MINIIEAGKTIAKSKMVKFVADLEVYTFRNCISILIQRIYSIIHMIIGFFARLAKKQWSTYVISNWDDRYQDVVRQVQLLSNEELYEVMIKGLGKRIGVPGRYREVGDMMSSYLVNYAMKRFKTGEKEGLSIPEKVEYIYEKYPHLKSKNERKVLVRWGIMSCIILLAFGLLARMVVFKKTTCILLCVILEIVYGVYISRKMRIRWALHYIWLARTEYGSKLADVRLQIDGLESEKQIELKEDLQVLHSCLWISEREQEKVEQLQREITGFEQKIRKNTKRVEELHGREDSDADSMRRNLMKENQELKLVVDEIQLKQEEANRKIAEIGKQITEESNRNALFYKELWADYSKIILAEDVLMQILKMFSFEDLRRMEKRLYELNHVINPQALLDNKNGSKYLSFRTEQGDLAKFYINFNQKEQRGTILSFEREEKLQIEPLTSENIKQIMDRRGEGNSAAVEAVGEYIKRIEELSARTKQLQKEKHQADLKLQEKVSEIFELKTSIAERTKKCNELECELIKVSDDKEKAAKVILEYENNQAEIATLSQRVKKSNRELADWKVKCGELDKEYKKSQEAWNQEQKHLEKRNKELTDNVKSLEKSLSVQKQIVDEAKKKQGVDKKMLQKLEETNKELKNTLNTTKGELDLAKKKKEELDDKYQEAKKQQEQYEKELKVANDEIRQKGEDLKKAYYGINMDKHKQIMEKVSGEFPGLSKEAMIVFATAEQLSDAFGKNQGIDYSPVLVEYCKVIEITIWAYLNKSTEYQKEVEKCFATKHGATLGSAGHIISEDKSKSLGQYGPKLLEINKLRNQGAHKGTHGWENTENVKQFLWNTELLKQVSN